MADGSGRPNVKFEVAIIRAPINFDSCHDLPRYCIGPPQGRPLLRGDTPFDLRISTFAISCHATARRTNRGTASSRINAGAFGSRISRRHPCSTMMSGQHSCNSLYLGHSDPSLPCYHSDGLVRSDFDSEEARCNSGGGGDDGATVSFEFLLFLPRNGLTPGRSPPPSASGSPHARIAAHLGKNRFSDRPMAAWLPVRWRDAPTRRRAGVGDTFFSHVEVGPAFSCE